MGKRRHRCDVPGCGRDRDRWQRLCIRCFRALPAQIRTGIIQSFKRHDMPAHRAWQRDAAAHMAPQLSPAGAAPGVDSATAYANAARLTGDRDDDWLEAAE
jgi:hypothetical protein